MNEFIIPNTLKEAVDIIKEKEFIIFAGGTDLMVKYRFEMPEIPFIFIGDLKELRYIEEKNGIFKIGSCVKYVELLESEIIPDVFKEIIRKIGSPSIRNMGTIGGNICNASPAADTLPFLYAMDAEVLVISNGYERMLPISEFIKGPKDTILKKFEILKEISFKYRRFDKFYYRKVGLRNANSLSKLSIFCAVTMKNKKIQDIRISFGAVSPVVIRNRKIEEMMIGMDKEGLGKIKDEVLRKYSELIKPIDDQRSTANYRKGTALSLLADFFSDVR